jgi:hypothetical protein
MGKYNFNKDIGTGETGELVIADLLLRLKPSAKVLERRKDNKYDIALEYTKENSQHILTYEVKTDVYSKPGRETGNMFIEYESRGKKSGIETTEADWFVYFYPIWKRVWFIKTEDLKKILNNNDIPKVEFAGDKFSNTKGYLLPRWQYFNDFIVYEFTDETFTKHKLRTKK